MTDLTDAQRWILALGAVLNEANENDHVHLGGVARPEGAAFCAGVLSDWEIRTPEQAITRLAKLVAPERTDGIAWDLGRAVNVAGWSYGAYLLDAKVAWDWMMKAAAKLQATLGSFSDFGESYLRGRDAWRGRRSETRDDKEQRAIVKQLLASKGGPWAIPWRTSLAGATPPVTSRPTRTVDAAKLAKALSDAKDGDRIVVRAGTCKGPLSLERSVEIVADKPGTVTIQGSKQPVVAVGDASSVLLAGVSVRGGIHVAGFLRLEGCTVTSPEIGIDVIDDDAHLQLEETRVVSCGSAGVAADRGVLVARDTVSEKNETSNFQIGATAVLLRVRANASASVGMQIHSEADVSLEACEIAKNPGSGVAIREAARVTLKACKLRDNDTAQVWVGGTGAVRLDDVDVRGGDGYGLQVLRSRSAEITGCTITGTGGDAVVIHEAARPKLRGCTFTKASGAGVRVLTKADPTLLRCTISGNAEGVVIGPTAKGRFLRCRIEDEITRDPESNAVFEEGATRAELPGELGRKLGRLDELLDRVSPDACDAMRAGVSNAALSKLSKAVFGGKTAPDAVSTFFRWHDGQVMAASLHPSDNRTPLSVDEAIDAWKFLCDPKEDVQKPWSKSWLPLFSNGAGDYLCFITSGKDAGALVEYWHDDADRKQPYASLEAWADDLIAKLTG